MVAIRTAGAWRLAKQAVKPIAYTVLLSALMAQCASNVATQGKIDELNARSNFFVAGADKKVIIAERMSPEANRQEAIRDFIGSAMTWTKRTSEDFQEKCKALARKNKNGKMFKNCASGLDPGIKVPNLGTFTTNFLVYQSMIAPEGLQRMQKFILSQKPPCFDQGCSRELSVDYIGASKQVQGTPLVQNKAVLTWTDRNPQGVITDRRGFDSVITTRAIVGPTPNAASSPISDALNVTLARRIYIVDMQPLPPDR